MGRGYKSTAQDIAAPLCSTWTTRRSSQLPTDEDSLTTSEQQRKPQSWRMWLTGRKGRVGGTGAIPITAAGADRSCSRETQTQPDHSTETPGCHALPHLRNLLFPSPSSSKSSLKNRNKGNCGPSGFSFKLVLCLSPWMQMIPERKN